MKLTEEQEEFLKEGIKIGYYDGWYIDLKLPKVIAEEYYAHKNNAIKKRADARRDRKVKFFNSLSKRVLKDINNE